eukprot:6059269-Heterocapsa_arctica.AAC.1
MGRRKGSKCWSAVRQASVVSKSPKVGVPIGVGAPKLPMPSRGREESAMRMLGACSFPRGRAMIEYDASGSVTDPRVKSPIA